MAKVEPGFLATVIGSMPHTSPEPACQAVLKFLPHLPAWPQLPKRSYYEGMYLQYGDGLPGVVEAGERIGLTVTAGPERTGLAETVRGVRYQLKVGAMDQPGIVHRVTHLLHSLGANVEDLRTQLEAGAHSGTPLFKMDLMMTVPPEVRVKDLRAELERLCDALNCDYELAAGG